MAAVEPQEMVSAETGSDYFWTTYLDSAALMLMSNLSPTHWGLHLVLHALTARAYAQGSASLLARAVSLVQNTGVGLSSVTGPVLTHGVQHTVHTTFEAFSDIPKERHDRALTRAPQSWSIDSLGERLVYIMRSVAGGRGHIAMSGPVRALLGEELIHGVDTVATPVIFVTKALVEARHADSFIQACKYIMLQYRSRTMGPLTVKVPCVTLKSGVQYDLYLTVWGERLGHLHVIVELVPVNVVCHLGHGHQMAHSEAAAVPESNLVGMAGAPVGEMQAAHGLANLMGAK